MADGIHVHDLSSEEMGDELVISERQGLNFFNM